MVEAYCTWRVEDPLTFYQKFVNSGDRAEDHAVEAMAAERRMSAKHPADAFYQGGPFCGDDYTADLTSLKSRS